MDEDEELAEYEEWLETLKAMEDDDEEYKGRHRA